MVEFADNFCHRHAAPGIEQFLAKVAVPFRKGFGPCPM